MTVQGFVQSLLAGLGVVDPVDVFAEVGMVVVVLQGQVSATDPANVEKMVATNLKYSTSPNVPVLEFVLYFQNYIPMAVYPATQYQFVGIICREVQGVLTGSVWKRVLF